MYIQIYCISYINIYMLYVIYIYICCRCIGILQLRTVAHLTHWHGKATGLHRALAPAPCLHAHPAVSQSPSVHTQSYKLDSRWATYWRDKQMLSTLAAYGEFSLFKFQ